MKKIRPIAFYLPQFHPIKENDTWWGTGFTEWTNVGKAKKLFRDHYQPRVPADLGYYDLRLNETRVAQAEMAKKYGIEGFCYWHYWFGNGKRLLERPFNEVLISGSPDFPFCLAWANETWKGFAHGLTNRNILIEQEYPGELDDINHFNTLLPAFKDKRYIKINNRPIFLIYKPKQLINANQFIKLWQKLALENGLSGIHFIAQTTDKNEINNLIKTEFDAVNLVRFSNHIYDNYSRFQKLIYRFKKLILGRPNIVEYKKIAKYFSGEEDSLDTVYPTAIPNWDHSPRSGNDALVIHNSTPELFSDHLKNILDKVKNKKTENNLVFIKSWNEWAEGNYLEPDIKYGKEYLEAFYQTLIKGI
jgi:lipopolysaccharide biosynthesis protein